jgi:transcriptional regulator NrdR family protein
MNCPNCGYGWSTVVDCRTQGSAKRVRKECTGCGNRFTIWEITDQEYKKLKKQEKTIATILSLMEVLKKLENEDN